MTIKRMMADLDPKTDGDIIADLLSVSASERQHRVRAFYRLALQQGIFTLSRPEYKTFNPDNNLKTIYTTKGVFKNV